MAAPGAKPRRGPTAYFVFADEQRGAAKAALVEAAGPGAKVSVAAVAKEIGERWRALGEEAKQRYKDAAAAAGAAAAEAAAAEAPAEGEAGEAGEAGDAPRAAAAAPAGLPPSIVRRIMLLDPDVQRVAAPAAKAMALAAELFIGHLAERGASAARRAKRRTVKLEDLAAAAKTDRRLGEMGFREVLADCLATAEEEAATRVAAAAAGADGDAAGAEGGAEGGADGDAPAAKKARKGGKGGAADAARRPITAFFTRQ